MNIKKLLTTAEVAVILGAQPNTIEGWRTRGVGPKFRKVGSLVRYAETDVEAYLEAQTRRSTSDGAAA